MLSLYPMSPFDVRIIPRYPSCRHENRLDQAPPPSSPLVLVHVIRLLKVAVVLLVLLVVGRVLRRGLGVVNDHTARAAADHVVKVNALLCVFLLV